MHIAIANALGRFAPITRGFWLRRSAYRAAGVGVGDNTRICGGTRLLGANVTIGNDTWLGVGTVIISTEQAAVSIGDRCDVGPGVMFVVGTHEPGGAERRAGPGTSAPVSVGDGTWVGARAMFIAGASVGPGSVVAAGSVVTREFPGDVLVAGVPAVIVRELVRDEGVRR